MVLAELVGVIEGVKRRAKEFQAELQKSEALTRYALVDPLLRALGWDTADPAQVRPEFPTESGNPDYALLWEGKPHIMVEAKALGKSLDAAKDKGFQYCWKNKVSYYAITDGNAWEVHDLREMGGKVILRVVLSERSPGEAARELLSLWRPAMPTLAPPPRPLLEEKAPPPPKPPHGTLSLVELEEEMKSGKLPRGSPPPTRIVFPDGTESAIKYWRDLLVAVVEWAGPKLEPQVPIRWPNTGRTYVAKAKEGMRFPKPVGPYWVETNFSALYLVKTASYILSVVGEDRATVRVALK